MQISTWHDGIQLPQLEAIHYWPYQAQFAHLESADIELHGISPDEINVGIYTDEMVNGVKSYYVADRVAPWMYRIREEKVKLSRRI
jgi:hypothetical protein